jgi:hypothetical protein
MLFTYKVISPKSLYATIILSILLLADCALYAQVTSKEVPNGIAYQAILRSDKGDAYINKRVTVEVSIIPDSKGQEAEYTEQHTVYTNAYGLISLAIGQGSRTGKNNFALSLVQDILIWVLQSYCRPPMHCIPIGQE